MKFTVVDKIDHIKFLTRNCKNEYFNSFSIICILYCCIFQRYLLLYIQISNTEKQDKIKFPEMTHIYPNLN